MFDFDTSEDDSGPMPDFDPESCQHCNSDDVSWDFLNGVYICDDCGKTQ